MRVFLWVMEAECYTYQIAIRDEGHWLRDYVCACDKYQAMLVWLDDHPLYSIGWLAECDEVHCERCA